MKKSLFTPINVFIVCLFIAGAALRLYKWSFFSTLAGDEGVQLLTIEHFLKYGKLPILGEISALDTDNEFLFHNSPVGYYILTLIYLLGLKTPEGYTLIIVIFSLLQAYLLFKTADMLFNRRAAIVTLILALFSANMLYASTWVSQPVLAIFFETLGLYLYAKYKLIKAKKLFWGATALSLLATQLYPPMILLLPFKAFVWVRELKILSPRHKIRAIEVLSASIFLLFLPFLTIELTHNWKNTQTVLNFFQTQPSISANDPIAQRLTMNVAQVIGYIFPEAALNPLLLTISVGVIITVVIILLVQNPRPKMTLMLTTLSFGPALLVSFLLKKAHLPFERAYLFVVTPFLILWIGALMGKLPKKIFLPVAFLFSFFLFSASLQQISYANTYSHIQRGKRIAHTIINHAQGKNLDFQNIDLLAISSYDPYGWETSYYWYELEKQVNQYLVNIDPDTSKAARISSSPLKTLYVICHAVQDNFSDQDCLHAFEEKIHGTHYAQSFILEQNLNTSYGPIFVMNVVPTTTNVGGKTEMVW